MTDEAPTAAEVEALIARAEKSAHYLTFPFQSPHIDEIREAGKVLDEAAAALAAQAQRIAELERERNQALDQCAELHERIQKAEAALAQAVANERSRCRAIVSTMRFEPRDVRSIIAEIDAAPAAPRGKP